MLRALRNSADEDNDYSLDRGWSVTRIGSLYRGNIRQLPHGTWPDFVPTSCSAPMFGDIRTTDEGGVIHVRGKGGKDRRIPVEQKLIEVLDNYRDSRAVR
jgi:hypothetical protein